MDALLIFDMQAECLAGDSPRHDRSSVVSRINKLAGIVRLFGGIVVFISTRWRRKAMLGVVQIGSYYPN